MVSFTPGSSEELAAVVSLDVFRGMVEAGSSSVVPFKPLLALGSVLLLDTLT